MNVVIYARYSSHSQTEQSIEGQLAVCREYAQRNNYTIVGEYIDRALSGTNDKRPQFQKMIEDSNKKYFEGVLVYQLDRFARNRYDSATYKNKLKKNGVRVFSARENISDDASGVLIESILDYVRADYTDYAIMINGEWGSGKTHFWNNKIRNKIESLQLNGRKYTTIYMSLYGISNLEDISKKIFIETTQLMDKNLKKYMDTHGQTTIPEYAKTGLDMANFFGVTKNGEKIDYGEFFATNNKILCFDDLERANVDVIDILGYINNFVEHDHIKTIIICNEKELSTKLKSSNLEMKTFIATYLLDKEGNLLQTDKPMVEKIADKIEYVFDKANDYERIKEKLIGETFEYAPKFNYIINGILMRYENNKDLITFLRQHTNLITNTFMKSGTRNLRILKHALNDFQKVFDNVNKAYPNIEKSVDDFERELGTRLHKMPVGDDITMAIVK